MITLRDVTAENYDDCIDLSVSAAQADADFADPVVYSLAEAYVFRDTTRPFAIYADDVLVGFVLLAFENDNGQIVNFVIDQRYQHQGHGKEALQACVDYLTNEIGVSSILLAIEPTNKIAEQLYERFGFVHTGENSEHDEGKLLLRMDISETQSPVPTLQKTEPQLPRRLAVQCH